jgi:protein AFG1
MLLNRIRSFRDVRFHIVTSSISINQKRHVTQRIPLDEHITRVARIKNIRKPSQIYDKLATEKIINDDSFQRAVCVQLDELNDRLIGYTPCSQSYAAPITTSNRGFFSFFTSPKSSSSSNSTKVDYALPAPSVYGLYIHGNVGTGKTMLMDMFYSTSSIRRKKRIHFNRFMLDIHDRIAKVKRANSDLDGAQVWNVIADQIIAECTLLCFDEFQVTDIADAMIMKLLFEALFRRGLVVISTSNREPEKLYENGLQRQNFVPFIPMLQSQVKEVNLDSGMDYRRSDNFDFNFPSWIQRDEADRIKFHYDRLYSTYGDGPTYETSLNVLGHKLRIPRTSGRVAEFTFDELCAEGLGEPLGAADYLALADHFDVIIVRDVPRIDLFLMNSMLKRMITMIDNIYDNHVGLLLILEDNLENLYYDSDTHERELTIEERQFMDDHAVKGVAEGVKIATLSGSEEAFAIERKISRLSEMSSEQYWAEVNEKYKNRNS